VPITVESLQDLLSALRGCIKQARILYAELSAHLPQDTPLAKTPDTDSSNDA
jgi:hypothetical protein